MRRFSFLDVEIFVRITSLSKDRSGKFVNNYTPYNHNYILLTINNQFLVMLEGKFINY